MVKSATAPCLRFLLFARGLRRLRIGEPAVALLRYVNVFLLAGHGSIGA